MPPTVMWKIGRPVPCQFLPPKYYCCPSPKELAGIYWPPSSHATIADKAGAGAATRFALRRQVVDRGSYLKPWLFPMTNLVQPHRRGDREVGYDILSHKKSCCLVH
jgi:hypothetical protein